MYREGLVKDSRRTPGGIPARNKPMGMAELHMRVGWETEQSAGAVPLGSAGVGRAGVGGEGVAGQLS